MKKVWLAILMIGIAALLYLFLFDRGKIGDSLIIITDDGFQPSNISVKKDSRVTFRNEGKNDHWPVSDNHPTGDLYPEFDPKKPISPGSSWSFTFLKTGEWGFHDHFHPEVRGVIIVQ